MAQPSGAAEQSTAASDAVTEDEGAASEEPGEQSSELSLAADPSPEVNDADPSSTQPSGAAEGPPPAVGRGGLVQCRVTCDLWNNGTFYPEGTVDFFHTGLVDACQALERVDG